MTDETDNLDDPNRPPVERDDRALAAEYALGLLPKDEAAAFEARLAKEPSLREMYASWEDSFAEMLDGADDTPPAALKAKLDETLFPKTAPASRHRFGWLKWATIVAASCVVLALFFAPLPAQDALVAELTGEGVTATASVDTNGQITLAAASVAPPDGKDYEVWIIVGGTAPQSLGVLSGPLRPLPEGAGAGALLALSVEPLGGSPTGQATGPVVAVGPLTSL